ncbi:MAG: hypothetical protein ACD_19C00176G0029 [uncultured bacterium]|nr:MAG: hypothetical protein ACD_19C00176G0029 [uncultured bacterium]
MSTQDKDISIYFKHIKDSCNRIGRFIRGVSYSKLLGDELIQNAVIRQLEVIGEATRQIPQEVRAKYKQVNWDDIVGMRDKLVHDYIGVDLEVVWKASTTDVPILRKLILKILKEDFI